MGLYDESAQKECVNCVKSKVFRSIIIKILTMISNSKSDSPPISAEAYERIFQTIHSIVKAECLDETKSCIYFGILGAYLLDQHHGLKSARPLFGVAGYNLRTPTNFVTIYGRQINGEIVASGEGFHCWVEVNGWTIDFSAPLFGQALAPRICGSAVPPLMFMKTHQDSVVKINDLNIPGAYLHRHDKILTLTLMSNFLSRPINGRLADVCAKWYVAPPGDMSPVTEVIIRDGQTSRYDRSALAVTGSW